MRSIRPTVHTSLALAAVIALAILASGPPRGDGGVTVSAAHAQSEATQPQRHFRVRRPAKLSDAEALTIYEQILDELVRGYGLSGIEASTAYVDWRRFNTTPYRSSTHGSRYVNNYANAAAKNYGEFPAAGIMPQGTLLAKDSFAVTARGDVTTGPLFLMEKMQAGFSPATGDWRYTMIMPDGSLFGVTKGEGSMRVKFCGDCHALVGAKYDHMYFLPKEYRRKFLDIKPGGG